MATELELLDRLRLAVADPGAVVERDGDGLRYLEPIARWSARAALESVVAPLLIELDEERARADAAERDLDQARAEIAHLTCRDGA